MASASFQFTFCGGLERLCERIAERLNASIEASTIRHWQMRRFTCVCAIDGWVKLSAPSLKVTQKLCVLLARTLRELFVKSKHIYWCFVNNNDQNNNQSAWFICIILNWPIGLTLLLSCPPLSDTPKFIIPLPPPSSFSPLSRSLQNWSLHLTRFDHINFIDYINICFDLLSKTEIHWISIVWQAPANISQKNKNSESIAGALVLAADIMFLYLREQ